MTDASYADHLYEIMERPSDFGSVPRYMRETLVAYIMTGRPTGAFLELLLSNDLMGAISCADDANRTALPAYAAVLYNYAPRGCYGSPERYTTWLNEGGLLGLEARAASDSVKGGDDD